MKQTDFAKALNRFLTDYLVNKRGSSSKTIDSYRYAFIFLLDYYNEVLHIPAEKMTLKDLTYEHLSGFLDWLQKETLNLQFGDFLPQSTRSCTVNMLLIG